MYRKILVALDHTSADETLIPHIMDFARLCGAQLLAVHVADGFGARQYHQLNLAESEEILDDRKYLDVVCTRMREAGLTAEPLLAMGDPATELIKLVDKEQCDLVALTTHGHRLLGDIIHGATIDKVRHAVHVPLLIVRAAKR